MNNYVNNTDIVNQMANDKRSLSLLDEYFLNARKFKYTYNFTWLGIPIIQHPADIVILQELVYQIKPKLIVETGIAHGGSLLFYASLLSIIDNDGIVIGVDIDIREKNKYQIEKSPLIERIRMINGSSVDANTVNIIRNISTGMSPTMVILDSNHTHDHVLKELEIYSDLVSLNSYLVVMDTRIEDMPDELFIGKSWGKGNNPKTAVWEFLKDNDRFIIDKSFENRAFFTGSPDGFLKRLK